MSLILLKSILCPVIDTVPRQKAANQKAADHKAAAKRPPGQKAARTKGRQERIVAEYEKTDFNNYLSGIAHNLQLQCA
jgi:hypothetical protein